MNIPYEMPPRESPLIRITLAKLRRTLSGLIKLISPPAPTHMYGTPERLFYPVYIGDIFRIIHQTIIKAAYYEAYNDTATQRQYDILASMLADYIIVWSYYHPSHGRNPNAVSNCLNWVPRSVQLGSGILSKAIRSFA
ncbi:hypothetical protein AAP_05562 [Ascosphaera apis ARSEF 7405]|uniref:Uncharacterized protein n=1 Tax=Ascosphaera apis ARSEF 7405 TaxID=392613 RepID=A0A167VKB3_9EURO|nr:hypothetical protein AAP_05562 [Ascosphaera apis ARSEF 7405]